MNQARKASMANENLRVGIDKASKQSTISLALSRQSLMHPCQLAPYSSDQVAVLSVTGLSVRYLHYFSSFLDSLQAVTSANWAASPFAKQAAAPF
jgi:hypothetical protein